MVDPMPCSHRGWGNWGVNRGSASIGWVDLGWVDLGWVDLGWVDSCFDLHRRDWHHYRPRDLP